MENSLFDEAESSFEERQRKKEEYEKRLERAYIKGLKGSPLKERFKHDPSALKGAPEVKALAEQLAFLLEADYNLAKSAFEGAAKRLLEEAGGDYEGLSQTLRKMTGDYSGLESPYQLIPSVLTQYARRTQTMAEIVEELKEAAILRSEVDWVEAGFVSGKPKAQEFPEHLLRRFLEP